MGLETRINTMLVFGFTINSSGGKYKPIFFCVWEQVSEFITKKKSVMFISIFIQYACYILS